MQTKPTLIAITHMAGIFPDAPDLDAFWRNLAQGRSAVSDRADAHWSLEREDALADDYRPDKALHTNMGLLPPFELDFTGLPLDSATLNALDPLYHLLLQTGQNLFRSPSRPKFDPANAGFILASIALPTTKTALLAQAVLATELKQKSDILLKNHKLPQNRAEALGTTVTSLPAALFAHAFGLGGINYTLDAACASSLFAVKLACDELAANRANVMLAGGLSRPDSLYTQIGFTQLKALSKSGRCAPFDAEADGLIVGEGCGIMVLKRLEDARRDDDQILAVIHAVGVSNDMDGTLLAPATEGQLRAMRRAYATAGWRPEDVDLIECHGAGTPLGDKTELASLSTLWQNADWRRGQCALSSVKSMTGHLLTAAGMAGLMKTILSMRHGTITPTLNFNKPAPNTAALTGGPFYVPTQAQAWPRRDSKTTRKAAVSAFGFGGTNAHLLLEEWDSGLEIVPKVTLAVNAPEPIAIVGMGLYSGTSQNLTEFRQNLFQNHIKPNQPPLRAGELQTLLLGHALPGMYINELRPGLTDFNISPNELADILPQHLLMLMAARAALGDAGMDLRADKPNTGALIGMDFDLNADNFCMRWLAQNLDDGLLPAHMSPTQKARFKNQLADYYAKPLTHNRVLGNLGGIIAARLAKTFRLGAMCSTISSGATSGLRALAVAVGALQTRQADCYLAGAVDFTGNARQLLLNQLLGAQYAAELALPFDENHKGGNPGDGAVCLVLKRLDDAERDHNLIYAVVDGLRDGFGWDTAKMRPSGTTFAQALPAVNARALGPVELVVGTAEGMPGNDDLQADFLSRHFPGAHKDAALTGPLQTTGNCGAASGLLALAATALCLHHGLLPGLQAYMRPAVAGLSASALHLPRKTVHWTHNHSEGPRTALCSATSSWGHTANLLLREHLYPAYNAIPARAKISRALPVALRPMNLFTVEGGSPAMLAERLQELWLLATSHPDLQALSLSWHERYPQAGDEALGLAFIADDKTRFDAALSQALAAVQNNATVKTENLWYNPAPVWQNAKTAVVFPGSGNQFLGMGRGLDLRLPGLRQQYDFSNAHLKDQLVPRLYAPYLSDWAPGYEQKIWARMDQELLQFIFGQTAYCVHTYQALKAFEIGHDAVAGYSLGESAMLFATGAWNNADAMMAQMEAADLFKTQLFGSCLAFRQAFKVPDGYPFKWTAVWLNCTKMQALAAMQDFPYTALLIVDAPDECIIGGDAAQIKQVIARLGCQTVYLRGVASVHCKAVGPVQKLYRDLHTWPVTPVSGLTYYSCARARAYDLTAESAGATILEQALYGFDFTKLTEQMYADGYRVFIEAGPGHSLTRLLDKNLGERPHLALSISKADEAEDVTLARLLGRLVSERIHVNFDPWFAGLPRPLAAVDAKKTVACAVAAADAPYPDLPPAPPVPETAAPEPAADDAAALMQQMLTQQAANSQELAAVHEKYLDLSAKITHNMAQALLLQAGTAAAEASEPPQTPPAAKPAFEDIIKTRDALALYPRAMCIEFARGLAQNVLGPEFADVDTYEVRVRLPDEPLMLADRIMEINAAKGVLGPGSMITEHDVKPDAWYLDGGHAPVCIAVEAGQADLFLSAYMGIDKLVQGRRAYRLLDAVVEFHRELPAPGEIIAYHINIERFFRHGATYLFCFNFTGYIGAQKLITMTNGRAGFFTKDEVQNSGGILPKDMDAVYKNVVQSPQPRHNPVPVEKAAYDDDALDKLRHGYAGDCFGPAFKGVHVPPNLQLPKGQMHLLDRVLEFDPNGGRWGLGSILGETCIRGNEWFLECHFVDDKVMPGTLMYECCGHTLRVFLQRMGWLSDKPEAYYGSKTGVRSKLKCRGPVTPQTQKVTYALEIKEIGFEPHPYVLADAFMYADNQQIVWFQDMPMQLCNATWNDVVDFWRRHQNHGNGKEVLAAKPLFSRGDIEEFCIGSAGKIFGAIYAPFDQGRYMARLPKPPFLFIDRVLTTEAAAFKLETGHKFVSEFDINPQDWYFKAERNPFLPTVCLMEIALQPCGFSTVYMGAALLSPKDLHFRNLNGNLTIFEPVAQKNRTLVVETLLTKIVKAHDMLLLSFELELRDKADNRLLGAGQSTFGFFPGELLATQKGFAASEIMARMQRPSDGQSFMVPKNAPLEPQDRQTAAFSSPALPAGALCMLDRVESLSLDGGSAGRGFICGSQEIDPDGWFFDAHFPGDPVCPGSLGVEACVQLLKIFMLERFPNTKNSVFRTPPNSKLTWDYRGQILRHNKQMTVMADITSIAETPYPHVSADAVLLADGVHIYTVLNIELELVPDYL